MYCKWNVKTGYKKGMRGGSVTKRDVMEVMSWKASWKGVMETSRKWCVMEASWKRCHGSVCHGKMSWKWCVMEVSWKGVVEVMRHRSIMEKVSWKRLSWKRRHGSDVSRKRHGKGVVEASRKWCVTEVSWKWCDMEASRKGVMEVVCHGSVMERRRGSDAS